jgi:hypothetical protein
MKRKSSDGLDHRTLDRRRFRSTAVCAFTACYPVRAMSQQVAANMSESLTKEQRDSMTPDINQCKAASRPGEPLRGIRPPTRPK